MGGWTRLCLGMMGSIVCGFLIRLGKSWWVLKVSVRAAFPVLQGDGERKKGDTSRRGQVHRMAISAGDDPEGQKLELLSESRGLWALGEGSQRPESLTVFQRLV